MTSTTTTTTTTPTPSTSTSTSLSGATTTTTTTTTTATLHCTGMRTTTNTAAVRQIPAGMVVIITALLCSLLTIAFEVLVQTCLLPLLQRSVFCSWWLLFSFNIVMMTLTAKLTTCP